MNPSSRKGTLALSGVRVVSMEVVVSGPFCTSILADMGAEVVKIERPGTGDIIRKWDSAVRGLSSGFVWLNRNKRSLSVDVKKEMGEENIIGVAETFLEFRSCYHGSQ